MSSRGTQRQILGYLTCIFTTSDVCSYAGSGVVMRGYTTYADDHGLNSNRVYYYVRPNKTIRVLNVLPLWTPIGSLRFD